MYKDVKGNGPIKNHEKSPNEIHAVELGSDLGIHSAYGMLM